MIGHLISSTLAAIALLLIVSALPKRFASLRFTLLFLSILRFALPTVLLTRAGIALADALPHRVPALAQVLTVLSPATSATPLLRPSPGLIQLAVVCFWLVPFAVLIGIHMRRLLQQLPAVREPLAFETEALCRASACLQIPCAPELSIAASSLTPCVLGLFRPVVILPDGLSKQFAESELSAVLLHELAHIKRRDNLVAALVRVIVSVFWFHPLLWWIENRMLTERETACDQLALAGGVQPHDYVAGILRVCRMSLAGVDAAAGASDSNLSQRMEQIMSTAARPVLRFPCAIPAACAVLAIALPVTSAFLAAQTSVTPATTAVPGRTNAPAEVAPSSFEEPDRAVSRLAQRALDEHRRNSPGAHAVEPSPVPIPQSLQEVDQEDGLKSLIDRLQAGMDEVRRFQNNRDDLENLENQLNNVMKQVDIAALQSQKETLEKQRLMMQQQIAEVKVQMEGLRRTDAQLAPEVRRLQDELQKLRRQLAQRD